MALSVIIVTHNSEAVLPHCLDALAAGAVEGMQVFAADSGSTDAAFLRDLAAQPRPFPLQLLFCGNVGFAAANNRAVAALREQGREDTVLFLNPDAYVQPQTLALALEQLAATGCGALGGRLLGCRTDGTPTERLDSTGIRRRWFGRWYDRGQGEVERGQYAAGEEMPALCGAFLLLRHEAAEQLWQEDGTIFDPAFFLYKEDIELCLRLRRHGWRLWYAPQVQLFHCRGWAAERGEMPLARRLMAAENEIRLYLRRPSPYLLWAVAKYLLVRLCKV